MGVKGGSKALHFIRRLTREELARIIRGLAEEQQITPSVVGDVSSLLDSLDLKVRRAAEYSVDFATPR